MNEQIAWTYPYPIAAPYRRIFTSLDTDRQLIDLKEAIEGTFEFLAIVAIADIFRRWPATQLDNMVTQSARKLLVRPALGHFKDFFRRTYLEYARQKRIDTFFAPASQLKEFLTDACDERRMQQLVSIRNAIVHDAAATKEAARSGRYITECAGLLADVLQGLAVLGSARLVVPFKAAVDGGGAYGVSRGASEDLIIERGVALPAGADALGVLYYESASRFVPLQPLLVYVACECGDPCLGNDRALTRLQWLKDDNREPEYVEFFAPHVVRTASLSREFHTFFDSLAPDYRYQHDPYLRGAFYRATEYQVHLDVWNERGDTSNAHQIHLQRILYESEVDNPRFKVDYHDENVPVTDNVFDLRVTDTTRSEDCPLSDDDREIWNEGFRSYTIGFATPLAFDEERKLVMSMFEAGLFTKTTEEVARQHEVPCRDYYEISLHIPVEVFELRLTVPPGARINAGSITLRYLEDRVRRPKLRETPRVEPGDGGRDELIIRVTRPELNKNLFLEFEYSHFPDVRRDRALPWYWASHLVYEALALQEPRDWSMQDVAELLQSINTTHRKDTT